MPLLYCALRAADRMEKEDRRSVISDAGKYGIKEAAGKKLIQGEKERQQK